MPQAFIIMPYRDPYNLVYDQVIRPQLANSGFDPVRADEIPTSTDIHQAIVDGISRADLVIVEATEVNANVYWEFGLASALAKEMILLAQAGAQLPFDTSRLRHLRYDLANLEQFRTDFARWVENTSVARKRGRKATPSSMQRGEIFPDIFDSTSYLSRTARPLEDLIFDEIRSGAMISCQFAYRADKGALHWLALCDDALYTVYHESLSLLSSKAPTILSALGDSFLASAPDFISLGPGNGQKDRILLRAIFDHLVSKKLSSSMFYYPVDVSERILSTAINTIMADTFLTNEIKVKAIHADIAKLALFRPVFDFRAAPNLLSFLGNTPGNVQDEISFLKRIKAAMQSGDAMLLEVRLNSAEIELGGAADAQKGLSFAPLALLGVPFDANSIYYRKGGTLSQIPGTVTITGHYRNAVIRGRTFEDILLSCVNHYDRDALAETLTGSALGFDILKVVSSRSLGLYLLRAP